MSYTPTTWQTGDTITAEKLNNMESGIAANAGYWIPLDVSGGVISVPADKMVEVNYVLQDTNYFNILGCKFSGGGAIAGHRINNGVFSCPLTKDAASEVGISGLASLVVRRTDDGSGNVTVEIVPDVFIVTLTPTSEDFSGTMNKTVGEINAAYEAGQKIRFHLIVGANEFYDIDVIRIYTNSDGYRYFHVELINIYNNLLIDGYTGGSDPTSTGYATAIYQLTPMS